MRVRKWYTTSESRMMWSRTRRQNWRSSLMNCRWAILSLESSTIIWSERSPISTMSLLNRTLNLKKSMLLKIKKAWLRSSPLTRIGKSHLERTLLGKRSFFVLYEPHAIHLTMIWLRNAGSVTRQTTLIMPLGSSWPSTVNWMLD